MFWWLIQTTEPDAFCLPYPEISGRAAGEPQRSSPEAAEPPPGRGQGKAEDAGRADRVRKRPTASNSAVRRRTGCVDGLLCWSQSEPGSAAGAGEAHGGLQQTEGKGAGEGHQAAEAHVGTKWSFCCSFMKLLSGNCLNRRRLPGFFLSDSSMKSRRRLERSWKVWRRLWWDQKKKKFFTAGAALSHHHQPRLTHPL